MRESGRSKVNVVRIDDQGQVVNNHHITWLRTDSRNFCATGSLASKWRTDSCSKGMFGWRNEHRKVLTAQQSAVISIGPMHLHRATCLMANGLQRMQVRLVGRMANHRDRMPATHHRAFVLWHKAGLGLAGKLTKQRFRQVEFLGQVAARLMGSRPISVKGHRRCAKGHEGAVLQI